MREWQETRDALGFRDRSVSAYDVSGETKL
jgi:hypothetical protein